MKSLAILPIFLLLVAACAIQQRVEPAAAFKTAELCIIENPDVRPTFLEVYRRQLALRAGGVPRLRGHIGFRRQKTRRPRGLRQREERRAELVQRKDWPAARVTSPVR
jgi:hypothetical protein